MSKIRESLIKKTAEDLQQDEHIVERVVMNQFKQANKALSKFNEIEISGFGKFLQSQNKIKKRIEKAEKFIAYFERMLEASVKQEDVILYLSKITDVKEDLLYYKSKLKPDEVQRSVGRVEESPAPRGIIEGSNTASESGKTGHLQSMS